MKRAVSVIASLMLLACVLMPENALLSRAYAADEQRSVSGTADEIAEQFADPSNDPFGYRNRAEVRKAIRLADDEYPKSFDLRNVDTDGDGKGDTSYITPVKLQDPFGTCWGFSAIAAAESSILSDPEFNKGLSPDTFDLSEKHIAYFAATALDDPDSPQNGEGVHLESVAERLDQGGMAPTATSLFSSGIGPNLESLGEEYRYKGARGWTEKAWIDGKYQNVFYTADDDWSLPESLRFTRSYILGESYMLPSPAGHSGSGTDDYVYDPSGTAAIKEQLMSRRAVEIGYVADVFDPDHQDHGEYMSSNWAQYTSMQATANHQVCIVGWDDDYDRSNFIKGQEPPENGAWLVKNSWGSEEEQFPNHGEGNWGIVDPLTGKHTGYFWLSYYDKSMDIPEALDFDAIDTGASYRIDQHDLMPINDVFAAAVKNVVRAANIFKPDTCEQIRQVSCLTTYPGTEVTFEVYLLNDEYDDPTDGLLMDTETEVFKYGGYHKVDLSKPFIVMKGQSYAIVVTQKTSDKKYAVNVQASNNPDVKGIVNKGESFILMDGKWQDYSSKKLKKDLLKKVTDEPDGMAVDNFSIKGYGIKLPNLSMIFSSSGTLDIPEPGWGDMYMYLSVRFKGDWDVEPPDDVKITWDLEEGGEQIVDIKDGGDPSTKALLALKCGKTRLIVTAEGIGTLIYPIDISPYSADIIKMTAKKKKLAVALESQMYRKIDGYQVRYRIKGKKAWKTKEIKPSEIKVSGKKDIFVLKNLKKGKRYQVKVRSWADTSEGRYYGTFGMAMTSKKIK